MDKTIRIELPNHLRTLAGIRGEVHLAVAGGVTQQSILDALETHYPVLRGTIRDPVSGLRRPFLRFFAEETDLTHKPIEADLPPSVAEGREPLLIVGAIAGG